jgi:hypothetical protein
MLARQKPRWREGTEWAENEGGSLTPRGNSGRPTPGTLRPTVEGARGGLRERGAEQCSGDGVGRIVHSCVDARVANDGSQGPDRDRIMGQDTADPGGERKGRRRVAGGERGAARHRGLAGNGYVALIRSPAATERLDHEIGDNRRRGDRREPRDRGAPAPSTTGRGENRRGAEPQPRVVRRLQVGHHGQSHRRRP